MTTSTILIFALRYIFAITMLSFCGSASLDYADKWKSRGRDLLVARMQKRWNKIQASGSEDEKILYFRKFSALFCPHDTWEYERHRLHCRIRGSGLILIGLASAAGALYAGFFLWFWPPSLLGLAASLLTAPATLISVTSFMWLPDEIKGLRKCADGLRHIADMEAHKAEMAKSQEPKSPEPEPKSTQQPADPNAPRYRPKDCHAEIERLEHGRFGPLLFLALPAFACLCMWESGREFGWPRPEAYIVPGGFIALFSAEMVHQTIKAHRKYVSLKGLAHLPLEPPPPEPECPFERAARLRQEVAEANDKWELARCPNDEERTRHIWITGASGTGKTCFMHWLAQTDICQPLPPPADGVPADLTPGGPKRGVTVIDPAGDLVARILHYIPERRVADTTYFDLKRHPVPIDFFSWTNPEEKPIIVASIISLFESLSERTGSTVGNVIESVLTPLIYTLLDAKGTSFLDIHNFLTDKRRYAEILAQDSVPQQLKDHWGTVRFSEQNTGPILRRLSPIVWNEKLASIFAAPRDSGKALKISDIIAGNKVLLVNLAAGQPQAQKIVASLIIGKIVQHAFTQDPNDPNLPYHMLYVDEFPAVQVMSDFTDILSKARKFRLCLTVANQWCKQIAPEIFPGLFSVPNIYIFRPNPEDVARFRQAAMHIRQKELYNRADKKERPDAFTQAASKRLPYERFLEVRDALVPFDVQELLRIPDFRAIHRKSTEPVRRVSTPDYGVFQHLSTLMQSPAEAIRKRTLELYVSKPEPNPHTSVNGKRDPEDTVSPPDDACGAEPARESLRSENEGPSEALAKKRAKRKRRKNRQPKPEVAGPGPGGGQAEDSSDDGAVAEGSA